MKHLKTGISRFLTIGFLAAATLIALPQDAQACRDCPFPAPVGRNRWQMPDSNAVIEISQKWSGKSFLVSIKLFDSRSGEMVAVGLTRRLKDQQTVQVKLLDRLGNHILAKVRWVYLNETVIQAKLECEHRGQCLLNDL